MEISKELELMRREESSCFRELWRLGNDLRKLQKNPEVTGQKAEDRGQRSQMQAFGTGDAAEDSALKNEGASGYIEENTSDLEDAVATPCPPATGQPQAEPLPSHDILTELGPAPPTHPCARQSSSDPWTGGHHAPSTGRSWLTPMNATRFMAS
jgi:hypothetical protein